MNIMKIDDTITDAELIELLQADIARAGTMRAWCRANGFSPSFVSDLLSGVRNVTDRLASSLGYRRANGWRKQDKEAVR